MKFQTPYSRHEVPGESSIQPSMTIPDQSMTIAEILAKFHKGLPFSNMREEVWNGEEDLPDLSIMDLADRQELIEHNKAQIQDLRDKAQKEAKAKKETKIKAPMPAEGKPTREDVGNEKPSGQSELPLDKNS